MSDSLSSHELLASIAGSGDAAAEYLVARGDRLVRLARRLLDSRTLRKEDPEDVMQSVLTSFVRRRAEGQLVVTGKGDLWRRLFALTEQKCRTRRRYYKRDKRDVAREVYPQTATGGGGSWCSIPEGEPTPEEAAILNEIFKRLMNGLDARDCEIVRMRFEGHKHKEIVRRLRSSERTVGRVMDRIRKRIERMEEEEAD